jgi:hypothetical protein
MQAQVLEECLKDAEKDRIAQIRDSYQSISLKIDNISTYDLKNENFLITINGRKEYVKIPVAEAQSFKENLSLVKVTADKQLMEDAATYDIFNIQIKHPITGSIYLFGKQKEALFIKTEATAFNNEKGIPNLAASAIFSDPSSNRILDAGETAGIEVTVSNYGKGTARNIMVSLSTDPDPAIYWEKSKSIIGLAPGASSTIRFNISATKAAITREILFRATFNEENGFYPAPLEILISCQEFKAPELVMIESGISEISGNNNNIIENLEVIKATILVQNRGYGIAKSANAEIKIKDSDIRLVDGELVQALGDLSPGDSKTLTFLFAVNNNYDGPDILPIEITLSESEKEYGSTQVLGLQMRKINLTAKQIIIKGQQVEDVVIPEVSLTADVDKNIPVFGRKYENRYALVIGNEDYSNFQAGLGTETNVDFALNDAIVFRQYLVSAFGFEESQVKLITNATRSQIQRGIDWLTQLTSEENGEAEIVFYYSGHGLPDETSKEPYLIPVDVNGSNVTDGIGLGWLFDKLNQHPTIRTTIILDACFSGGARNQPLLANKGVRIKPSYDQPSGNTVVFSSSTGEESSSIYQDKQHGLFTYFLLKKLQETKGEITYKDLNDYLSSEVARQSIIVNSKKQTPTLNVSPQLGNQWESWKLK